MIHAGVWHLSWRHLRYERLASTLLVVCLALSIFLPVTSTTLIHRYQVQLTARATSTPLLMGAPGNRFDLTLAALYFRAAQLDPIRWDDVTTLQAQDWGTAVPLLLGDTARQRPIVATTPEYYDHRGLRPAEGTLPLRLGDAILGAEVARKLELGAGDTLFSDPREIYDIARPAALKLRITGVLAAGGTSDDDAVFVGLQTGWLVGGHLHGHGAAAALDPNLRLGGTDEDVILGPALIEHNEITGENVASFHAHGDESALPVTAVMMIPRDAKSATLARARINVATPNQMVVPREVIDDLMSVVFRVKSFFDLLSLILGLSTALLALLVLVLSMRLRRAEMTTLDRIGCSPGTVVGLYASEAVTILVLGCTLAAVATIVTLAIVPDLADVL